MLNSYHKDYQSHNGQARYSLTRNTPANTFQPPHLRRNPHVQEPSTSKPFTGPADSGASPETPTLYRTSFTDHRGTPIRASSDEQQRQSAELKDDDPFASPMGSHCSYASPTPSIQGDEHISTYNFRYTPGKATV